MKNQKAKKFLTKKEKSELRMLNGFLTDSDEFYI